MGALFLLIPSEHCVPPLRSTRTDQCNGIPGFSHCTFAFLFLPSVHSSGGFPPQVLSGALVPLEAPHGHRS